MASLPQDQNESGRRVERKPIAATVQFRAGTRRASVSVRDISQFGARVSGVFLVRQGDTFFLKLPSIEAIEARVVWVEEFEFGCEFTRPINDVVLESVLRAI
jgi:hypothetical protein